MLPYIFSFIATLFLTALGESTLKKNKKLGILILIIALLPIVILGGLRETSMGWDTETYCVPIYNDVKNMDLLSTFKYSNSRGAEIGFVLFVNIMSKIYNNINFILFSLIALISYSVLYFAYSNRDKTSIVFCIFLYETVLYSITYSTLRQCAAMSFVLISYCKFFKNKKISSLLFLIIACLFHNSAYLGIALFAIKYINDSSKLSKNKKKFLYFTICIIIAISVMSYNNVMNFLYKIGLLNGKYINYLGSRFESNSISIRWPLLLYKTFNIFMSILYFKSKNISSISKDENKKWFVLLIIDYIITFFSFKISSAHRSTYYILFPSLFILIPQTIKIFKDDKKNKFLAHIIVCSVYILYFLVSLKYYSIYPYRSIL